MTATPAQIDFITNLRSGWGDYLANQQAADTGDRALFEWLKAAVPSDVVAWYCEREGVASPKPPRGTDPAKAGQPFARVKLTQEEWDAENAVYRAETDRLEPLAAEAYIAHTAYRARAWAFAMTVDTATLTKEQASAAIDLLKNR